MAFVPAPRRSLPKSEWDGPFYVVGGVYTDMTFSRAAPGTAESYGPFDTYDYALSVWRGKMGWNVDNCFHRLFIVGGTPKYTERDDV